MEEKRLVPVKRFTGFTSNWSKNKLENLASFSKGKGYSKKDLTNTGHQLILYGRLYTKYETIIQSVDTYTIKQENSLLSKGKEVIVPSSGEKKEDIARASAILGPNIIIGGDLNVIIPSKELDSVFLALNISNGSCQTELIKRAQGSSVVHLYNEDLISVTLHFPSIEEQQKIGAFFKVLDERIANQERKVAKVKALKAAYLSEMFPQEGETVPRRRFKGFEGKWELIKFKDIGNVKRGLTYKPSDVSTKGVRVLRSSNIEDNNFVLKQDDVFVNRNSIGIEYADNNNILITAANGSTKLIGKHAITKGLSKEKNVPGGFMLIVETNVPNFLNASMYTDWYKKFLTVFVSGGNGSIGNLSKGDLEKQSLLIPNKQEQQKIGQFFKNIDDQIEMEEKKLDKLQKMKEAYLEEMFV